MFTGIIEKKTEVAALKSTGGGKRLLVWLPKGWKRPLLGSSIAVDGACLTVVAGARRLPAGGQAPLLTFDLLAETLRKTHFRSSRPGDIVNLERPVKSGQRIDGHIVQGHVDGTGKALKVLRRKREKSLLISFPKTLKKYLIPKGSIAVNGVSLTLGKTEKNAFWVHVIPHTLKITNLADLSPGDRVHLEADALLKFYHRDKK